MIVHHRNVVLVAIALGFAVHGCLDFTPITSVPVMRDDASLVDGNAEAAPSGKQAVCLACISGGADAGGCSTTYDACSKSAGCNTALQCLTQQCVAGGNLTGACLSACEDDAGVTSGPASAPFSALLSCLISHCEASCI